MTNLAADMSEPDTSLGDRSNKTVTFTIVDAALNSQTFTAATDSSGHASVAAALTDGVYGVSVSFAGDDFYLPCATSTDTLVTIQTAGAKVAGAGWIAIGTGKTFFGFNAIPQAGGTFKGQFQLCSNSGENRFRGNVVYRQPLQFRKHGHVERHRLLERPVRLQLHDQRCRQRRPRCEEARHDQHHDQESWQCHRLHDGRAAGAEGRQHHRPLVGRQRSDAVAGMSRDATAHGSRPRARSRSASSRA
jgi:hypothetical protein